MICMTCVIRVPGMSAVTVIGWALARLRLVIVVC